MYTVPVIPPDLRHEETIIQAANALNCLQSTITNIFDRIDKRILKNNEKINELSSRINSASQKIQNLSGTNKAIKIFSPAKFPSSHVFRDIELTFNDAETAELTSSILDEHEISSRVDLGPSNIQEKLVFFHFRSAKSKSFATEVSTHRGLGNIPTNLKSINSVLLFSTADNVYGARKVADDMRRAQRSRNSVARKAEVGTGHNLIIEPAPLSLSKRQKGADMRLQGIFYTPKLNEAPTIDLPADLPDLPGIAGDIQFAHADNNQIAPSLFFENLIDLPKVPANVENTDPKMPKNEKATELNAPQPTRAVISSPTEVVVPSPPPPPPVMPEVKSAVPPPPPPAPPMNILLDESKKDQLPPIAPPEVDLRSNLMDAIRKAGGARGGRLRAAADVAPPTERSDTTQSEKPKPTSGGDLMADLHNKLLMRRKGISGAKDGQTNPADVGNVITRLSSLIPPPPIRNQNSSSDEDDAGNDTDWAD